MNHIHIANQILLHCFNWQGKEKERRYKVGLQFSSLLCHSSSLVDLLLLLHLLFFFKFYFHSGLSSISSVN